MFKDRKKLSEEALEKFKKLWLENIDMINKGAIERNGIEKIRLGFRSTRSMLEAEMIEDQYTIDIVVELDALESKLDIALENALGRYKIQHDKSLSDNLVKNITKCINIISKMLSPKRGIT